MTTLAEIESALEALPRPKQEELLMHLTQRLSGLPGATPPVLTKERRMQWLEELRLLRERTSTGVSGTPLQQIMDEIREERC